MKRYLKQVVGSGALQFLVLDEQQKILYRAVREAEAHRAWIRLFNQEERCVAYVRQTWFLMLELHTLTVGGCEYARLLQTTAMAPTQEIKILGPTWSFRGNLLLRNFDVIDVDHTVVMSHCKRWGAWGDGYEINVANPEFELACLCLALCLDYKNMDSEGQVAPV